MSNKSLIIARLEVSNVMRLSGTSEIVPNGDVITLKGKNKAGKSSLLNAINMLFGGAAEIPERPLHDGTSRGHIIADLQEIVITRKFSSSGAPTVSITSADGQPLRSPQAVLDGLWNKMCDPVKFIRLSETPDGRRKQAEILRKLANLDFTELDAKRLMAFEERTAINRELASAQAKLSGFKHDPTAPAEEVSAAELLAELNEIQARGNAKIEDARHKNECNAAVRKGYEDDLMRMARLHGEFAGIKEEIEATRKAIEELQAKLQQQVTDLSKKSSDISQLQETIDLEKQNVESLAYFDLDQLKAQVDEEKKPIEEKIQGADEINVKVRTNRRRKEIAAEVRRKEIASEELTRSIEAIDNEKKQALKNAKFPLPGLSFDDDGITLDGVPFNQGSTAERLMAAMAIGIALEPQVKVIIIRGGNDLDDESMEIVKSMAKDHGFQIWIESVRSDDPNAILIENGSVKE